MTSLKLSSFHLDPDHISCIGGRTVVTCRGCAGNAPRGVICTSCGGRGFNIFTCGHCNPSAGVAASSLSAAAGTSSATANTTPGSSGPSSPGSLSRSPSTCYPSHSDPRSGGAWRPPPDARDGTNYGRVGAQTPRNL